MLRANCSGCKAEGWVNGLPVARVDGAGYPLITRPVHEYLLPGDNQLLLLVEPGSDPEVPLAPGPVFQAGPRAFATLELLQGPRGVFADDPSVRKLASIEWRPAEGTNVQPPVQLRTSVSMSAGRPRWSWLQASPLALTDTVKHEVYRFLSGIAEGLTKGDPAAYLAAASIKFDELAQAYGVSPSEPRGNFTKQWARLSAEPGFRVHPLAEAEMALRLCGEGRVIECLDKNFEPMLRAEIRQNGTTPARYPALVARVESGWRIVR